VVAIIALIYLLLAVGTDLAVDHIPVKAETWLGDRGLSEFPAEPDTKLQTRLDRLLTELPADSELRQYNFRTYLSSNEAVNAIALPGGNIVVFAGLLKEVKSENELAMILGHELGHFAHRDHLRGLGRGLGLSIVSALLFGENSAISNLLSRTLLTFQSNYSRQQEEAADAYGLQLLASRYGHVGGADDFFVRGAETAGSKYAYLFASHPHPSDRIEHLQQLIVANNYLAKQTEPLADVFTLTEPDDELKLQH
jgi:predicted Zn-dependent protease